MSDKRGPCKACEEWECRCVTSPAHQMANAQLYGRTSAQQYQPRPMQEWAVQQAQASVREPQPDPRLKGLTERLTRLLRHRVTFLAYMAERQEDSDFHAVSDAANDLRELECEIRCVEEMIGLVGGSVK